MANNPDRVRLAEIALWVAVIAITLSAGIIGRTTAKTEEMEKQVKHLEESYDYLNMRYAQQTAWLQARGIKVPE